MPGSAVYSEALKEFVFAFSELMLQRHNTRKQRVTELRLQDSELLYAGKCLTTGSWWQCLLNRWCQYSIPRPLQVHS